MAMRNAWDILEGESSTQREAFRAYMLAGPRRAIAKPYPGTPYTSNATLHKLGNRYNWVERSRAWDSRSHEEEEKIILQERVRWRIRRAGLLDELGDILERSIHELKKKMDAGKDAGINIAQINKMYSILLQETREEFGDKKPSTQINVDARQLKIAKIEIIKDYGSSTKALPLIEGEVIDA